MKEAMESFQEIQDMLQTKLIWVEALFGFQDVKYIFMMGPSV